MSSVSRVANSYLTCSSHFSDSNVCAHCESFTGKVPHKEFQSSQMREFSRPSIVVLAARPPECMILFRIIVDCDQRILIERA